MRDTARLARSAALALFLGLVVVVASSPPATAMPARPNDPAFRLQWNLEAIGAPAAWAVATGAGTTIAIVDSGIDLQHEDLAAKITGHVSCLGTAGDANKCSPSGGSDDDGHGTHVAGIAAAATDNGRGVAGVAPDAALLDVKALEESCDVSGCTASGSADDVAAAIVFATDHGATVINLSLGNTTQSVFGPAFGQAVDYAWSKGVIAVVAAGNDFLLPSGFSDQPAIVVGALDRQGEKASYANNIGTAKWALMAPGGEADTADSCRDAPAGVLSTYFQNGYACLAGTSMAAPHVAGAVALLRSMGLSPQQTVDRLLSTAKPMGATTVYGAGALDVAAAVSAPAPGLPPADNGSSAAVAPLSNPPAAPATDPAAAAPPAAAPPDTQAPVALPAGDVGGRVTANAAGDGPPLPRGPVVAAVTLASTVACASGWQLLRGLRQSGPAVTRS